MNGAHQLRISTGESAVNSLYRKLFREIWSLRGQLLSIAAVVAVGAMTVLTMRGTYESLALSRDLYYRDARFPDAWAQLKRAPEKFSEELRRIPGVSAVRTRVTFSATLDVPDLESPAMGRFVSIPEKHESMLADLHVISGRYVAPGRRDEVLVSKKFAAANDYEPGDTLTAVINGSRRDLRIVGTAISPEYTYAVPPGALYPDDKRYGVIWMSRAALGPAYDMDGAFNEVVLALSPGASPNRVLAQLDDVLEPYGGLGAYARENQASHLMLDSELQSNRTMGTAIPIVFLSVAAFLLNIVLGRMIATQRTEIAVLKAFGYTNTEVGLHYLRFAMVAVFLGALLGVIVGIQLGHSMVELYGEFFDFPALRYRVNPWLIAIAVSTSALAASLGALSAVRSAASLPPAEAMRPEPPASFRAGIFERIGLASLLPAAVRMILRNVERKPGRSLLSAIGVAFSVAILVVGLFMFDGVSRMMDLQFRVAQREDLSLTFNRALSDSVRFDLSHLKGVGRVEGFRSVPVRLRVGHLEKATAITGMQPRARLRRIVKADGSILAAPESGVVLSQLLSEQLGLKVGDPLDVEVLEGKRRHTSVTVAGIVEDFMGVAVYMQLGQLQRLTRDGKSLSGAYLEVEDSDRASLNAALKQLPAIAGVASPAQMMASFDKQMAEGLFISVFFLLGFSGVISVAVIYNGARISLSERGRELASLRVFGFTRREVAALLFGEQALITLVGVPLGWLLGYSLAAAVSAGMQTETYRIPLVVSQRTFMLATLVTVISAALSAWVVKRRLDTMSLVEVLKTRE